MQPQTASSRDRCLPRDPALNSLPIPQVGSKPLKEMRGSAYPFCRIASGKDCCSYWPGVTELVA
jgi:hypothetical protein